MISLRAEDGAPRLDRFLADRFPEIPRARWDAHVRTGEIKVNGEAVTKGGVRLRPGDLVETELPVIAAPAAHLEAEAIDLPTLFEDTQLWIVDKPAGMVVHPGPGHAGGTIVNALLHRLKTPVVVEVAPEANADADGDEISEDTEELASGWPGLVHRLDRYTTGCLCLAKTAEAQRAIQEQFKARTVEKRYLALVRHSPKLPQLGSLLIDEPIARHKRDRLRMVVAEGGRSAQTRIRVLARTTSAALVECELLTGRTHQIRVHLAHLRAPLMGDPLYGGPGRWKDVDGQALLLPHPALHAWKLSVDHPLTGARIDAEAPIPEAFRALAASLGLPGF
ncbi:pseudouridine synthase [Geothrix limicola]|uniref:Pseudouridine synthase n=1 Tax=Geothrix limicola TaxID=2927978 RepID=A0ABQ5QIV1_9BACT|nr:RluA family pseudouridine synthase [Geothrix limicola]GLH74261.1 pseudouridine synthase [Geothrix limicola]